MRRGTFSDHLIRRGYVTAFRPLWPSARSTTRSCSGAAAVLRARDVRDRADARRRRPTAGWRSSRPTIPAALIDPLVRHRATCCTCRRARPFTAHEVRLARAIGAVLAARYRAIFNPQADARARRAVPRRDRGSLRRRVPRPAVVRARRRRSRAPIAIADGDRDAARRGALSYENQPISTGVLLLGTRRRSGAAAARRAGRAGHHYTQALTGDQELLPPGATACARCSWSTATGALLDIVDMDAGRPRPAGAEPLTGALRGGRTARTRAPRCSGGHVCVVLSPSHEIKVFAEGAQVFTLPERATGTCSTCRRSTRCGRRRSATRRWRERLFQTALDLADARAGRAVRRAARPATRRSRSSSRRPIGSTSAPSRRAAGRYAVAARPAARARGRTVTDLDPTVLAALATLDGATVMRPVRASCSRSAPSCAIRYTAGDAGRRRRRRRADDGRDGRQPLRPGAQGERGRRRSRSSTARRSGTSSHNAECGTRSSELTGKRSAEWEVIRNRAPRTPRTSHNFRWNGCGSELLPHSNSALRVSSALRVPRSAFLGALVRRIGYNMRLRHANLPDRCDRLHRHCGARFVAPCRARGHRARPPQAARRSDGRARRDPGHR